MALKLIPSKASNAYRGYRPHWYGAYKDGGTVTTFNLGVLVRGEPPASGYIGDLGDETFEASRKRAEDKFAKIREKGKEKGDAINEQKQIHRMKTGQKFKDPALTQLADIYLKRIGERTKAEKDALAEDAHTKNLGSVGKSNIGGRSTCHIAMIRSCFQRFADFAAKPDDPEMRRARTLLEVSPELVAAFFRHVATDFAYSTVKRWSNLLTGAWDRLMPKSIENPFRGTRVDALGRVQTYRDEKTGEKVKVETVIHHRPIDRDQLHKLYSVAKDDDFLYPLVVTAASTGLRISDTCTLTWSSVHLTPKKGEYPHIMVESTAKTGAKIAVPIFDYDPTSKNYEPDLGEFRRVLEKALAESRDDEKFVFPKAAHLYLQRRVDEKTGREYFPGRDAIYAAGKRLFAKALFADEPEEAEVVMSGDEKPAQTADAILAAIDAAQLSADRKRVLSDIYRRRANGETYGDIVKATGYTKSTVSTYLADIEDISGAKLRTRSKPSVHSLLKKTRQTRSAGRRGASIYSWHSLRAAFVVMMRDNGVDIETLKELVGHTTTTMTLEYYNPTQRQAAEKARRIVLMRNRSQCAADAPEAQSVLAPPELPAAAPDAPQANLDALREALAKLTPEERAQLLK